MATIRKRVNKKGVASWQIDYYDPQGKRKNSKRMGKFYLFTLFVLISSVASCATPYQARSLRGGYSDTQLAPDVFRIYFSGNVPTSKERAEDFALLRAAELSLQRGFKHFAIIGAESSSIQIGSFLIPGSAQTTGTAFATGNIGTYPGTATYTGTYSGTTTYTPSTTFQMAKPHTSLLIKCFTDKPENVYTFDAAFIVQSLKQKYNIE